MKKTCFTLFLLLLMSISSSAQKQYHVEETELSKSEMWTNLKKWVSDNFKHYKYAVDLEDEKSGTLIIKFTLTKDLESTPYMKLQMSSSLEVGVKDRKYRYAIDNPEMGTLPNVDDPSLLSNSSLEQAISDMEFMQEYLTSHGGAITNYEKLNNDLLQFEQELNNTPKFSNKKKTKISKAWEKTFDKCSMVKEMRDCGCGLRDHIITSLKKAISFKDNW